MMKMTIAPCLYVGDSPNKGRGVFTDAAIDPSMTVEISSVLVMDAAARLLLDKTPLYNYIFEWGPTEEECCVAWGYISLYNHSYNSNCEYFMDFARQQIRVVTVRAIAAGEELTINYNGDWDDLRPLWFDAV